MNEKNNQETTKGQLILRDRLAENRTVLANERTLLSYVRTSLAFLAAGLSFIKFFDSVAIAAIGWVFLPLSAFSIIKGLLNYRKMNILIGEEENKEVRKAP